MFSYIDFFLNKKNLRTLHVILQPQIIWKLSLKNLFKMHHTSDYLIYTYKIYMPRHRSEPRGEGGFRPHPHFFLYKDRVGIQDGGKI